VGSLVRQEQEAAGDSPRHERHLHLRRAGFLVNAASINGPTPDRIPIENHRGEPIVTLADWHRLAPPTSPHHWREYRSAYELAHAWTEGDGAKRLSAVLQVREELAGLRLERGIAERKSWFDDIPGRPRQHDLLLNGTMNAGRLVVGLEAKADEPFDLNLAEYRANARRRSAGTRAPERLDRLTSAFFGVTLHDDPTLGPLRYQVLAALAGTLVECPHIGATVGVLAVHEFVTPETDAAKRRRNASDLDAFVARLGPAPRVAGPDGGWVAGPFVVPGNRFLPNDVPLYVAKVISPVERRSAGTTRPQRPGESARARRTSPLPRSPEATRRSARLTIAAGARVIKLSAHLDGCPCGCAGKEVFVLNRPGRHPRQNVIREHLDEAVHQMRTWARDALTMRDRARQNPWSTIAVREGMPTITLMVRAPGATPQFAASSWDTGAELHTDDLDAALRQVKQWVRAPSPMPRTTEG
jgi:hypothetical protein